MPRKDKMGKNMKGKKKGGKVESKFDKEIVVERAKANAALWEARLDMTEHSRVEYREAAVRLAKNNEDLTKHQFQMEKDIVDVIGYLKKQDSDKDELIEKLQQELVIQKKNAEEEKKRLVQNYSKQLNILESKYNTKSNDMRIMQGEMKMIKEFRKRKANMEKELDDIKENMKKANKEYKESLAWMERRFLEEKQRLEREAAKKIEMLAERAHNEAIVQLDEASRSVFKENVRLSEALTYHMNEAEELKKAKDKLKEERNLLHLQRETDDQLVQEKILQVTKQKSELQNQKRKVESLERALTHMSREFETEIHKTQKEALVQNQAGHVEIDKLQKLLEMKDREMNRVKKLAKNILEERTEVECFFLHALQQVKHEIVSNRKWYRQAAQAAYQRKMMEAAAGKEEYPKVRNFNDNEHSTNNVHQDLKEAEKWTNIQSGKVDISDLTWEQKEKVLRLLFAKINGVKMRKPRQSLHPSLPAIASKALEKKRFSEEDGDPSQTFITQPVPVLELPTLLLSKSQTVG
ncbi:basal body-orientation factor 1 [Microcaecilia unicolor]|uniref:Basal body-orientation factor 1 n=1 Tax=Microcaecilia unicolor TaxID=1415580 RepID=A0A6P7Z144_9AMPH|nr:basal body-orientation factor 1 [Microcaecilia unicolor]